MLKNIYKKVMSGQYVTKVRRNDVCMIGDVLDWLDNEIEKKYGPPPLGIEQYKVKMFDILKHRPHLRQPINEQPIECIEKIYIILNQ